MKTKTLILALGCALMLVAYAGDDASAGLFGSGKSKRTDYDQKVWRYDDLPSMNFARGKIMRDVHAGWVVGGVAVQFAPECVIADEDGAADLYDGAAVMIMGPHAGGTIVAWRIEILAPGTLERSDFTESNTKVEWSNSNRHVGVGTGPN
ncbi:MAG: hypothetical protein GY838_13770 [bacterium]|nr:hypothetical protein [bacterium]